MGFECGKKNNLKKNTFKKITQTFCVIINKVASIRIFGIRQFLKAFWQQKVVIEPLNRYLTESECELT
jgi:hypothetical protein